MDRARFALSSKPRRGLGLRLARSMAIVMAGILSAHCTAIQPETGPVSPDAALEEQKPAIVVALDSDIDHIEPMEFRSDGGYHATGNLYEPLVLQQLVPGTDKGVLEGVNSYGPGLADVTFSEDLLLATVKLREGPQFADGTPVTAHAYKHTLDRAMVAPRSYIPLLVQFMGFDSPEDILVVDDYTLEFHLDRPSPLFLPFLSFQVFGAMDPLTTQAQATDEDPWAFDWYRKHANASGPYVIQAWNPGVEVVFSPNPNYWQGDDYLQNSGVVAKIVPSSEERERLLKQGEIDLALGLPYSSVDALKANPEIKVYTIESRRLFYVGMNNETPPFDRPQVRQAVSYAIPYDQIVQQVLHGYAQQATSLIPAGMPTHTDEFWHYDTDLDRANAILAEAGLGEGFGIELTVRESAPSDVETAALIRSSLAKIGVEVTVNEMADAGFFERLNSHKLSFFIHDWHSWGNDPAFQLTFLLKCNAFTNYANYCNERLDEIIEQVTWTLDQVERENLMREAQQIISADAPWALLYQPDWIVGTSADFYGLAQVDELTLRFAHMGKE